MTVVLVLLLFDEDRWRLLVACVCGFAAWYAAVAGLVVRVLARR